MKKVITSLLLVVASISHLQSQPSVYVSGGPEIIFSLAEIDNQGQTGGNILRFAPVFNMQVFGNVDFGKHFGLIFGGAIRNVGFIYQQPDTILKKKYRNYNFGLPLGIKIGRMNKFLFYGGYEIEFPLHFKEKSFVNNIKQDYIISDWFTPRTPSYYHSVFFGVQFPYGFSLKFKYYFSDFLNTAYYDAGTNVYPYQGLKANIWYFSLNFSIFRNKNMVYLDYYENKGKHKTEKY